VPNPVILLAFLLLCVAWYWVSSDRLRALRLFATLRRLPVFGTPPQRPQPRSAAGAVESDGA
jgi:UDP-GlcNAc:undecaprenyl-phosphate GlcNAc-1-phosphate transferase